MIWLLLVYTLVMSVLVTNLVKLFNQIRRGYQFKLFYTSYNSKLYFNSALFQFHHVGQCNLRILIQIFKILLYL